jgi:hypothetical protein
MSDPRENVLMMAQQALQSTRRRRRRWIGKHPMASSMAGACMLYSSGKMNSANDAISRTLECTQLTRDASLAFSLILSVMDSSIVATALVTIGAHFDDFVKLQWVVLAYLLTYLGRTIYILTHRLSVRSLYSQAVL